MLIACIQDLTTAQYLINCELWNSAPLLHRYFQDLNRVLPIAKCIKVMLLKGWPTTVPTYILLSLLYGVAIGKYFSFILLIGYNVYTGGQCVFTESEWSDWGAVITKPNQTNCSTATSTGNLFFVAEPSESEAKQRCESNGKNMTVAAKGICQGEEKYS